MVTIFHQPKFGPNEGWQILHHSPPIENSFATIGDHSPPIELSRIRRWRILHHSPPIENSFATILHLSNLFATKLELIDFYFGGEWWRMDSFATIRHLTISILHHSPPSDFS